MLCLKFLNLFLSDDFNCQSSLDQSQMRVSSVIGVSFSYITTDVFLKLGLSQLCLAIIICDIIDLLISIICL